MSSVRPKTLAGEVDAGRHSGPFDELAFRDRLRASPRLAVEYAELKHRLAAEFEHDREAYTDAKAGFIRRALGDDTE